MSKHNRLDMLKNISLFDKHDDLSIFKSYIPNHYDEIYSLYNLLIESDIDYNDLDFEEPDEYDDSFTIKFKCDHKISKKLSNAINEDKKIIKYLRKKSFKIKTMFMSGTTGPVEVRIFFNKI